MSNSGHNHWLDWKIRHGLASRGRPGPLHPKGWRANLLYNLYYRKFDVKPVDPEVTDTGPRVFKQNVGGVLGASGTMNGE